jgi:hypothetical protein
MHIFVPFVTFVKKQNSITKKYKNKLSPFFWHFLGERCVGYAIETFLFALVFLWFLSCLSDLDVHNAMITGDHNHWKNTCYN